MAGGGRLVSLFVIENGVAGRGNDVMVIEKFAFFTFIFMHLIEEDTSLLGEMLCSVYVPLDSNDKICYHILHRGRCIWGGIIGLRV